MARRPPPRKRGPRNPPPPPRAVFSWAAGAPYAVPAEVVAAELAALERRLGHQPNAAEFVAAARNPRSPLHQLLPFDKTVDELAEEHLRELAADCIRRLRITYVTPQDRSVTIRARVSIATGGRRGFVPIESVLGDDDLRKQLLADALRDAELYIRRYSELLLAAGAVGYADRLIAALVDFLRE